MFIAGTYGNKGAIGVSFLIGDTSFAFIVCHFAAGSSNVEERNKDYWTICEGMVFCGRTIEEHEYVMRLFLIVALCFGWVISITG
jgi:hypothetical protein